MSLWSSFRRFSRANKTEDSGTGQSDSRSRSKNRQSLKHRDLRLEQFEQRLLLSITPNQAYLDDAYLDVKDAWDTATGAGVTVAIIDDGIDDTHTEIDTYRDDLSYDFMTDPVSGSPTSADSDHGTAIAGIIASDHSGSGAIGVGAIADGSVYLTAGGSFTEPATIPPFILPGLDNDFYIESPLTLGAVNDVRVQFQHTASSGAPLNVTWDGADTLTIVFDPGTAVVNDLLSAINDAQLAGSPLEATLQDDGSSPMGVAWGADIAAYRITASDPDTPVDNARIATALDWGLDEVDVFNVNLNYQLELSDPGDRALTAMRRGALEGRNGLGAVYVYGAGDTGGNSNYDALVNSRYSIAVGSAYDSNDDGTLDSILSAPGSATLVSGIAGPNGILTTDRPGSDGYDAGDYTSTDYQGFGGVQAAAAQLSGVVALMLEANPMLTYRDVQQILVESSSNWNAGAGSYDPNGLGWGTVNAQAAVQTAAGWDAYVAPEAVVESGNFNQFALVDPDGNLSTNDNYVESRVEIASDVGSIEWVEVTLYGLPDSWAGNEIMLTGPTGETSYLTQPHATDSDGSALLNGWTFTSAAHWGNASGGEWTLNMSNPVTGEIGTWGAWDLKVYGRENAEGDAGPELVKIVPNEGGELVDGDVLHVAPRELLLQFNSHQNIDENTLDGIQIVRSGGDSTFGDGNEETIVPGYIAKGSQQNEVIIRFAETLPDDVYRITLHGDNDLPPLRNVEGVPFNGGSDRTIRFTLDLGSQVLSVVPQPVYRGPLQVTATALVAGNDGDTFTVGDGFHEVTFEFNRDTDLLSGSIDRVTAGNVPIRFDADGESAENVAGLILNAIVGQLSLGNLDSDLLEGSINGSDPAIVELSGRWASISLGAGLAFDVQTSQKLQQATDRVDVYFNDDDLDPASATNPALYRLYDSLGTLYSPVEVFYDPAQDKAQLRFAADLPPETYHLEIGASDEPVGTASLNSTDNTISKFSESVATTHDAEDLGILGSVSMTITGGDIHRATTPMTQPGGNDEPGHRQIPVETHLNSGGPNSFGVYNYNFRDDYGWSTPNQIEENQKQRAREVLEIYAHYLGIEFRETASSGLTIVTGDLRAVSPSIPTGPGGVAGISEGSLGARVVMDAAEDWGQSEYGGSWFDVAMHEIGHSLGLGHTYDMPAKTIMGSWGSGEPVFPGNVDLIHARYIWPTASNEVNLYQFQVDDEGWFTAETTAERLASPSALDTKLVLYREYDVLGTPVREVYASNDDYYSDDSFIGLQLEPGTYYIGVMSTGMTDLDPTMENSGFGGTSEGNYELTLEFVPTSATTLVDEAGTQFDGDADGVAGGTYDFWFQVGGHTHFVDKADVGLGDDLVAAAASSVYTEVDVAIANAVPGDVVRVVGNDDDTPFLVGYSNIGAELEDGVLVQLPPEVTMMVDAGAVFKLQAANIDIGSSAQGINRAESALQVLGTPFDQVHFRSFRDDTIAGDSDGASAGQAGGDWGGLVFRDDSDREADGIFLNSVSFADIQHGGGEVLVDSVRGNYAAIHMIAARPTVAHNVLRHNAGGAISADLTSFEETTDRIGPDVHGNTVLQNTIDGLFVRIETEFGEVVDHLEVPARWDDTDIVHVVTENLLIQGTPGGELDGVARYDARLRIDAATVVKLEGSRIQAEIAGQLIAEGLPGYPIVFTSLRDDTYGMGGGFDTTNDGDANPPNPGQWGGLVFAPTSSGSLDYLHVAYGGGETSLGGDFEAFNTIEIHQADVRIANSYFTLNAEGGTSSSRDGLGSSSAATIFVRGAQPVILNNTFIDNNNIRFPNTDAIDDVGDIISIDVNSLTTARVPDPGRSTGYAGIFAEVADNLGPLVRFNKLYNNDVNSFAIRGGVLTTESVWDDTDIVHVVREEIEILNQHTFGGLRLQSSPTESLVIKLDGVDTGFTADGVPLDIDDRIGGTLQIVGQPNNPVVLTSLQDLSIGAGFTPDGLSMKDTLNVGLTVDAGEATPYVDVVVVMDESGSMRTVQQFTERLIPELDAALAATGIGDGTIGTNRFGLVGFGGSSYAFPPAVIPHEDAHSHLLNGNLWGTSTEYVSAAQTLTIGGVNEDGWDGIQYTLDNYAFRPDATKFIILATDEPRILVNPNVSYNSVLTNLQNEGVILEGILGTFIQDGNFQRALALDVDGTAYLEDGSGGYTTSPGGHFISSWWQTIITDYANMAFGTGGLVGDISQIGQGGNTTDSFAAAMIGNIIVQAGGGNPAGAGDWRGVAINEYANTRNVAVATEVEPSYLVDGGTNDIPYNAQVLGYLAPDSAADIDDDEKGGDENQRLGFEIHGHISMNDATDVDVYSFTAKPGTEVWIDIDRTSFGLDAMVELVRADGTWLARSTSNGSFVGNTDPTIINPVTPTGLIVYPWQGRDYYTSNDRDPAMHLVLPGTGTQGQNYFLRVSSENGTSGEYQLQLRLRQVDEAPGSTVRYADIRFATDGIEVHGQPGHSILSGEVTETPNNNNNWSTGGNQNLGNLLTSDRNTLSVAANISNEDDIDWYKFSLDYDMIQAIGGFSDGAKSWATVFDIDYSDGLSRGDLVLSIYDADGDLILVSRDSDIDDDQPGTTGTDLDDLSRGSVGTFDPFIGSVQMPAGVVPLGQTQEYYVAVSSNRNLPTTLRSTFDGSGPNALVRLEPINSVQRVAEDHIAVQGHLTGSLLLGSLSTRNPETSLFNISSAVNLSTNVVPYTLSDVALYISTNEGTNDRLRTVNPFTGAGIANVGGLNGGNGVGDIAMRGDGTLMTQLNGNSDGNSGDLRTVNTGTAALTGGGSDDLTTDNDGSSPYYQDFQAMAFRDTGTGSWELYAINNNHYDMNTTPADINDGSPAVWRINSDGSANDELTNNTTNPGAQPVGSLAGITGRVTGLEFIGSRMYAVDTAGKLYTTTVSNSGSRRISGAWTEISLGGTIGGANFSGLTLGPENLDVLNNQDVVSPFGVPDEAADQTAAVADVFFASTSGGQIYAFDATGTPRVVFDSNADGVADTYVISTGRTITGLAFSTQDFNLWHPTTNRRADTGHGINSAFDHSRDDTAWNDGLNGRSGNRNEGGASFYFGMENWVTNPSANGSTSYYDYLGTGNAQYGFLNQDAHRDISSNMAADSYDVPGGAHGKLVTNSFSLGGTTYEDKPTLYFNYFLETENSNSTNDTMRDSARVFISNNGGITWDVVATNNSIRSSITDTNELPIFISASSHQSTHSRQQVQELYDNTGGWRQARVDLGDYAGDTNLMLRFDFSTSGEMPTYSPWNLGGTDVDAFGNLNHEQRGQNNAFEGFYVDDIIIGYAERGEMVTYPADPASQTGFFTVPQNPVFGAPTEILVGDYQLEIRRGTEYGSLINSLSPNIILGQQYLTDDRMIPEFGALGDENLHREQDQLILEGNTIRDSVNYGILVDAGARDLGLILPASHPGGVIKTPVSNNDALVPGVVIVNNVIAKSGTAGIFFSGDAGTPEAPVPFGRIINNTIAGDEASSSTYGIRVTQNASPTILNNIITNASTAISIDASSSSTVVGYNLFKDYGSIGTLGSHPIDLDLLIDNDDTIDDLPLFVDPLNYNYYLASGALAIDSSLDVLGERSGFMAVKSSLTIPPSPIIAPEWDRYGQLRQDDPAQSPPSGMGASIFKDRGAIERADFIGPTALLADPLDNQIPRVDTTPKDDGEFDYDDTVTDVVVINRKTTDFAIQLLALEGIGIDDTSVNPLTAVTVYRATSMDVFDDPATLPRPLRQGASEDYMVRFDEVNDVLHVVPTSGSWEPGAYYVIRINNSDAAGIKDQAGNPLQTTRSGGIFDGQTIFTAHLTGLDFGDLPDDPLVATDYATLLDSGSQGGARHVVTGGVYLGSAPDVELDGHPADNAESDRFFNGDLYDDGVTVTSALVVDGVGELTVHASTAGYLNAWIDFDNNGSVVGDGAERIFVDEPLQAGLNTLQVNVPDGGLSGVNLAGEPAVDRYSRFRFSSMKFEDVAWLYQAGIPEAGFEGLAYDGEVEDYLMEIVRYDKDWGDAPSDALAGAPLYPTLASQDGASHYVVGPFLGVQVDAELDGQPTANASGDDLDLGGNDDDGIVFVGGLIPGEFRSEMGVKLNMSATTATSAVVEAWIDFNQDGIWADEWATTGAIDPNGEHDAFIITATNPGQVGTGIRVMFHADSTMLVTDPVTVAYDAAPNARILDVTYKPDTHTTADVVNAINAAVAGVMTADFVPALPNDGSATLAAGDVTLGAPGYDTTGGSYGVSPTTGVINPIGADNAFEIVAVVPDGTANGASVFFALAPGVPVAATWDGTDLTVSFDPDVTTVSDLVDEINGSGAPLAAVLSEDPNAGAGVLGAADTVVPGATFVLDGAYERIFTNLAVTDNDTDPTVIDQLSHFMVPADALPGATYARVRVSSDGMGADGSQLGIDGLALDGEVEDYLVTVDRVDYGDADVYRTGDLTNTVSDTLLEWNFWDNEPGNDGARHVLAGPWLGSSADHDLDGMPTYWADGDDLEVDIESGDDEDGVVFLVPGATPQVIPGGPLDIEVTLGGASPGYLDAWFDFDSDGRFDPSDQIFAGEPLALGVNSLSFPVDVSVPLGEKAVRFRVTADALDADGDAVDPYGLALSGEVEDYVVIVQLFDFGDAPDAYGTLIASDGARHVITGPWLGAGVDHDEDGLPSLIAYGDDGEVADPFPANGGDDEDGVGFSGSLIPGDSSDVAVAIGNAPSALVDAWIDFNGDGVWADEFATVTIDPDGDHDAFTVTATAVGQAGMGIRIQFHEDVAATANYDGGARVLNVHYVPGTTTSDEIVDAVNLATTVVTAELVPADPNDGLGTIAAGEVTLATTYTATGGSMFSRATTGVIDPPGTDNAFEILAINNGWAANGNRVTFYEVDNPGDPVSADWDGAGTLTIRYEPTFSSALDIVQAVMAIPAAVNCPLTAQLPLLTTGTGTIAQGDLATGPAYVTSGGDLLTPASLGVINPVDADNAFEIRATVADPMYNGLTVAFNQVAFAGDTASVVWNNASGTLTVTFESGVTTVGEIVTRINVASSPLIAELVDDPNLGAGLLGSDTVVFDGAEFALDGAYERILTNYVVDEDTPGSLVGSALPTFLVPEDAVPGQSFARFRVTSDGLAANGSLIGPLGLALDGEVEDYAVTIAAVDYGDAPDSYSTLRGSGGARHMIDTSGPYLGQEVDHDVDGSPTAGADGDDTVNLTTGDVSDDEDGVTFSNLLWIGNPPDQQAWYEVVAPNGGVVDVWIDFDGSGDWQDTVDITEHLPTQTITHTVTPDFTPQRFYFDVPANAAYGDSYARVRITSTGQDVGGAALTPTGLAANGEVEDYAVLLNEAPVADPGGPYWINVDENLALDASGSTDATDPIVEYQWDFTYDPTSSDPERQNFNPEFLTAQAVDVLAWPWYDIVKISGAVDEPLPVALRVVDSRGAYSPIAITELRIFENEPTALFTVTGADGATPFRPNEAITFDGTVSTHDRDRPTPVGLESLARQIVQYEWDFEGDGVYDYVQSDPLAADFGKPTRTFYDDLGLGLGTYTTILRVTDNNSPAKTDISSMTIDVTDGNTPPVANAGGDYTINVGDAVTLDGSGSTYDTGTQMPWGDSIVSWEWDLDQDGTVDATGENPTVSWVLMDTLGLAPISGQKFTDNTISLRVVDSQGADHSATGVLSIHENRPHAVLTALPNPIAPDTTVNFDGTASEHDRADIHRIVRYEWDFGDGSDVVVQVFNPSDPTDPDFGKQSHEYTQFGRYMATMRIVDDNVPARFDSQQVEIVVDQGNSAPTAVLSVPAMIDAGEGITLTGSSSSDPNTGNGDVISYAWTINGVALTASTDIVDVTWAELEALGLPTDGTPIDVGLTVTDLFLLSDSVTDQFQIYVNEPTALFDASPNPVACSTDVTFDASASDNPHPDHGIVDYKWDFNYDGTTFDNDAEGVDAVTQYSQFGDYDVALLVTDDAGKTAMSVLTVNVSLDNRAPVADAGGPYVFSTGQQIVLNAGGSYDLDEDEGCGDSIAAYRWDLDNDGDFDDAEGVQVMLSAGYFPLDLPQTIGLQVEDNQEGLTGETTTTVTIVTNTPPTADAGGPYTVSEGQPFNLDGTGSTDDTGTLTYEWDLDYSGGVFTTDLTGAQPTFTFNDDLPSRTIALRVTDEGSLSDMQETTITVLNVAPTAAIGGLPMGAKEGEAVNLVGMVFDQGSEDTHTLDWTVTLGGTEVATGSGVDFSFTPADNGNYQVQLVVTDDDDGVGTKTETVSVLNVAPTAGINGLPTDPLEGQAVNLTGVVVTDPGTDDTHTFAWTVTLGGTEVATGDEAAFSFTPADNGDYQVQLVVTDDDTGADTVTETVSVLNVAPTAGINGLPTDPLEGQAVNLTGVVLTDPGTDDTHTFAWTVTLGGTEVASGDEAAFSFTPADNGDYQVQLVVTDDDTGADTVTETVTVLNVAPAAGINGLPTDPLEGQAVNLTGVVLTDPGTADTHSFAWTVTLGGTEVASGDEAAFSFTPADNGDYQVQLVVTDDDTGADTVTETVSVLNVAPAAGINGLPTDPLEGQAVNLTGVVLTDPGTDDTHTFAWTVTLGGTEVATGDEAAFSFTPADNGDYQVQLVVTDDDGGEDTVTDTIAVLNADPVAGTLTLSPLVTIDGQGLLSAGDTVTLSGSFTDPGDLDTHTVTVVWGDGSTSDATVDQPAGTFEATHVFATAGQFDVVATVTDDDSDSHQAMATANVIGDLGVVDFRDNVTDLDPSAGDVWFELTTANAALLTVELAGTGATSAAAALFDAAGNPVTPLASGPSDGNDYDVAAGTSLFLKISGTAAHVDLRLTNLVSVNGSDVDVMGTAQDDVFEFELTNSYFVRINGTQYHFADGAGVAETVDFDGGLGTDSATFIGSEADESAVFLTGRGQYFSGSEVYDQTGFSVEVTAENLVAHSGGGSDFVKMYDSPGDDLFTSAPELTTLAGPGYSHEAHEFYYALGYATNREGDDRSGGDDQAIMHDSAGKDKFKLDWQDTDQFFGKLYGGFYYTRAKNFELIDADSSGGDDQARIFGSEGDDQFFMSEDVGRVTGPGFDVDYLGFGSVIAYAEGGYDVVNMEDSAGDDELRGRGHKTIMSGSGYDLTARNFEKVYATAGNGGYDKAKLHDTTLSDILHAEERGGQTWAQLAVDGTVEDPLYEVLAFEFVKAYHSEGDDKVDRAEEFDWLFLDGDWADE